MLESTPWPTTALSGVFGGHFELRLSGVFVVRFLVFLMMHGDWVESCGPVRNPRMSVAARLRPLFYNEHFPRIPETSFAASGPAEGRITRQDPRFHLLEPNYNGDIVFRDRGNPDAYLMTKRLKERINNLAISVANQWPGVKLAVRKGWSEKEDDGPNSLHYEGRAVDLLTSDKNKSHMGLLARLAVEAKFDWVHYEKKGYIHCSVKSEMTQSKSAGCFTGDSLVRTRNGPKALSQVQLGEELLGMNPETGSLEYSPLMLFLDRQPEKKHLYVHVKTSSGQKIKLTPSHLIMRWDKTQTDLSNFTSPLSFNAVPTFAKNIKVNDKLVVNRNNRIHLESVDSVKYGFETGMYAPLTEMGNIVVNDIVASCYAVIDNQDLAHVAFLPYRFVYNINRSFSRFYKSVSGLVRPNGSTSSRQVSSQEGIHWYAKFLYSLAYYVVPPSMMYEQ